MGMDNLMLNVSFVWLIAVPLLAAPLIYLAGRLAVRRNLGDGWRRLPAGLALLALLVDGVLLAVIAAEYNASGELTTLIGAVAMQFDGLSLLLAAVALGLGLLAVLFSGPYLRGEAGEEKYYAMLVVMIGVMIGLGCAGDLFNLWVWFEAMAVSSYLLVMFYREQPASLEASVKYVLQSASGSVLVLIGIALTLMHAGTLRLDGPTFSSSPGLLAAGALFVVGFGVKAALVPMHTWLPDAHAQAPSTISAMLSGVVIEAGLIAMLRALGPLSGSTYTPAAWGGILIGLGALNMLVGNLMALQQKQVKRLLAYSSLSHVGYMIFGIGVALYAGQAAGAQGGMFHLLNHG